MWVGGGGGGGGRGRIFLSHSVCARLGKVFFIGRGGGGGSEEMHHSS